MREFKQLDEKLLRLFEGDTSAFPDLEEVRDVLIMIKNEECKRPTREKRKFKKFLKALKDYCRNPEPYLMSDYWDSIFGLVLSSFLDYSEKGVGLEYLVGLPSNYSFTDYIQEFCKPRIQNPKDGTYEVEVIDKYISPNWKDYENKFIPSMEIDKIVEFFSELKKPFKKKEKSPFLSEENFDDFIKSSFCKTEELITIPKIRLIHGAKMAIVKLFYGFYLKCSSESLYNKNKDAYLTLLKEAFETDVFNEVSIKNFRPDCSKHVWSVMI